MSKKIRATYLDGEPHNIEAAALDALNWLCFFAEKCDNRECKITIENRQRLTRAIALLEPLVENAALEFRYTDTDTPVETPFTVVKEIEIDPAQCKRLCVVCEDELSAHQRAICDKPECSEAWQRLHAYRAPSQPHQALA